MLKKLELRFNATDVMHHKRLNEIQPNRTFQSGTVEYFNEIHSKLYPNKFECLKPFVSISLSQNTKPHHMLRNGVVLYDITFSVCMYVVVAMLINSFRMYV